MFPVWLQARFWGLFSGSALLVGAAIGYFLWMPQRGIAAIMAFGAGVLISALSFELMDEAYQEGGFDSTAIGFVSGAVVYTVANWYLASQGAKHRKRSGNQQPSEAEDSGSGLDRRWRTLRWHCRVNCDWRQHDWRRNKCRDSRSIREI